MPVHASILDAADLARIEAFFDAQAQSYGVALERPFRLHLAGAVRTPLHPQTRAEVMAGRIPIGPQAARIPDGLNEVEIGPLTAFEIG